MLETLYQWIQSIAVYLIVAAAVMHAVPGKEYGKYVRFFSGLVLILLLFTPVLKLTGMEREFSRLYHSKEYEFEKDEIEKARKIYEEADLLDFVPEEYRGGEHGERGEAKGSTDGTGNVKAEEKDGRIEVEGIRIGE